MTNGSNNTNDETYFITVQYIFFSIEWLWVADGGWRCNSGHLRIVTPPREQ